MPAFRNALPILVLGLATSGCSRLSGTAYEPAPLAMTTESEPLQLRILDEVNDGKRLYVAAHVVARASLSVPAVVRLRAMANGDTVGESFFNIPNSLEEGDVRDLKMSVDAENFTDYQIDLLWGQEARDFVGSLSKEKVVEVSEVRLKENDAGKPPTITGTLTNRGFMAVQGLTLLVQLVWVAEGAALNPAALDSKDDSVIDVSGIEIPAGEARPFAIELEIEIPKQSGGRYMPVVRVKD